MSEFGKYSFCCKPKRNFYSRELQIMALIVFAVAVATGAYIIINMAWILKI